MDLCICCLDRFGTGWIFSIGVVLGTVTSRELDFLVLIVIPWKLYIGEYLEKKNDEERVFYFEFLIEILRTNLALVTKRNLGIFHKSGYNNTYLNNTGKLGDIYREMMSLFPILESFNNQAQLFPFFIRILTPLLKTHLSILGDVYTKRQLCIQCIWH